MPDPKEHAENRGIIETVLRYIPGFRGYLEKEYRRESDDLQREWLADRLQRSKRGLDSYARDLTDAGQIDALPALERVRNRLERLVSRLRGGTQGYSGFFDFVRVDEQLLDKVYDHDVAMMREVEDLAETVESLGDARTKPPLVVPNILQKVDAVEQKIDGREDLLKGLAAD